jgi:hypothetical protein
VKPAVNPIADAQTTPGELLLLAGSARHEGHLFSVCARCLPAETTAAAKSAELDNLTHGICEPCFDEEIAALDAEAARRRAGGAPMLAALAILSALMLAGCEERDAAQGVARAGAVLILITLAVCACLMRRALARDRERQPKPWSLTREQLDEGFAQIRSAIPVDDDELARAKPVGPRWKRHEREKARLSLPETTTETETAK